MGFWEIVLLIIGGIAALWILDGLIEYLAENGGFVMVIIRMIILITSIVFAVKSFNIPNEEQTDSWLLQAFVISQVVFFYFAFSGIADIDLTYPTLEFEGFFDAFFNKITFRGSEGVGGMYWFGFIIRIGVSVLGLLGFWLIGSIPVWIWGDTVTTNVVGMVIAFIIEGIICFTGIHVDIG